MHPPEWRVSALRAALALAFPARAAGGFGLWPVDGEGVPGAPPRWLAMSLSMAGVTGSWCSVRRSGGLAGGDGARGG